MILINLTTWRQKQHVKRCQCLLLRLTSYLFCLIFLCWLSQLFFKQQIKSGTQQLNALNKHITQLNQHISLSHHWQNQQFDQCQQHQFNSQRHHVINVVNTLLHHLPETIRVIHISIMNNKTILQGETYQPDAILNYIVNLHNVMVINATLQEASKQPNTLFRFQLHILDKLDTEIAPCPSLNTKH